MIQFFKRLFAAIFRKKKVDDVLAKPVMDHAIYPDQARMDEINQELAHKLAVSRLKSRKWLMRNNRILIQYNGNCRNIKMNGKFESMRCTRLERAREIAAGIQSYCIEKIVFADQDGQQFIIKS